MSYWPRADGYGIVVQSKGDQVKLRVTAPSQAQPQAEGAIAKPKGAITAFNYYMMNERKKLPEQTLSNKELTVLMGKKWKSMTKQDKTAFEQAATKDKLRYQKVSLPPSCSQVCVYILARSWKMLEDRSSHH